MNGCRRLAELGLWSQNDCCGSCHDDWDELGIEPCSLVMPDGKEELVCCKAWNKFVGDYATYENGEIQFPAKPIYPLVTA